MRNATLAWHFTVDLKREELFKDGTRVKLPGKVYQTLVALAGPARGSCEQGRPAQRLWPEGTHVNYDAKCEHDREQAATRVGGFAGQAIYVETNPATRVAACSRSCSHLRRS